jgi:hypothetical protein
MASKRETHTSTHHDTLQVNMEAPPVLRALLLERSDEPENPEEPAEEEDASQEEEVPNDNDHTEEEDALSQDEAAADNDHTEEEEEDASQEEAPNDNGHTDEPEEPAEPDAISIPRERRHRKVRRTPLELEGRRYKWCTACCGWYDPRKDKDKGYKCTRCKEVARHDVDWSSIPMTDGDYYDSQYFGYDVRIRTVEPRRSTKDAHREDQVRKRKKLQFRNYVATLNAMFKSATMKRGGSQAVACVLRLDKGVLRHKILQIVHAQLYAEESRKNTFVWWGKESWNEPLSWP